jgi:hypothetical protein
MITSLSGGSTFMTQIDLLYNVMLLATHWSDRLYRNTHKLPFTQAVTTLLPTPMQFGYS